MFNKYWKERVGNLKIALDKANTANRKLDRLNSEKDQQIDLLQKRLEGRATEVEIGKAYSTLNDWDLASEYRIEEKGKAMCVARKLGTTNCIVVDIYGYTPDLSPFLEVK